MVAPVVIISIYVGAVDEVQLIGLKVIGRWWQHRTGSYGVKVGIQFDDFALAAAIGKPCITIVIYDGTRVEAVGEIFVEWRCPRT